MNKQDLRRQKISWLRRHRQYEKVGVKRFSLQIKTLCKKIPFEKADKNNFPTVISEFLEGQKFMYEAVLDLHLNAGKKEYNYQRQKIDRFKKNELKRNPIFNSELVALISRYLLSTGGTRIKIMNKTLAKYLIKLLSIYLEDNEDATFTKAVTNLLNKIDKDNFYRYQIERIVRTETTAAAQRATLEALEDPDIYIDKVWLSIDDDRTRNGSKNEIFNHLDQDGIIKRPEEFFNIEKYGGGSEKLMYPADPNGSAANVINCRCGLGRVPRLDKNGRPVMKPRKNS